METKLCRICGKLGQNYSNIFKTEGLKNKIETCLPIVISPYCLLPDTICGECLDNVDNFYNFIKNCLQNIIILEAQYDIQESCLKTKRKLEKYTTTTDCLIEKFDKYCQTDDLFEIYLKNFDNYEELLQEQQPKLPQFYRLVDYDIDTDTTQSDNDNDDNNQYFVLQKTNQQQYFDDSSNLIDEIIERKTNRKRKIDGIIENQQTKIFRMDQATNRRKNRQPKKMEINQIQQQIEQFDNYEQQQQDFDLEYLEKIYNLNNISPITIKQEPATELIQKSSPEQHQQQQQQQELLPQICLLCEEQFSNPTTLASHVFETHGIDMAQILQQQQQIIDYNNDKKKKLPNLVKISDLKQRNDSIDDDDDDNDNKEELNLSDDNRSPPLLTPNYVCPICPSIFTINRQELYNHIEQIHPQQSSLLCYICLYIGQNEYNLEKHIEQCKRQNHIKTRYYCKICLYGDNNRNNIEKHLLIHNFLIDNCRKLMKIYDPNDFIELNNLYQNNDDDDNKSPTNIKLLTCNQCGDKKNFQTFNDYSQHRRQQHSIFHCDLCNKFYGRNSHLWKHVNRLHKGHPSITCQLCYKTSASKYHLLQHFNKIHNNSKQQQQQVHKDDFMQQKFEAFDFQSVKQSFMRQELLEQTTKFEIVGDNDVNDNGPKEIDNNSDLYTNIITNYTPPQDDDVDDDCDDCNDNDDDDDDIGDYKCTKCDKAFHKRTLLKKHRKNCRPRLQKDLLTRCKTCSRIFKDRQSLSKHLINYHSEYSCEICGQTVQSKCEIITHIRFTHPQNNLICKLCKNILRNQYELKQHELNHQNSYVCQFCGDCLDNKIKLKMHILSLHRKILNLSCGICLKLFDNQIKLREHVRLQHSNNIKSLTTCPVCGKNYGSKWKTYDHLNKSHGRIFKACKICLEIYDDDHQLQAHYQQIHPNNHNNNNNNNNNNQIQQLKQHSDSDDDSDETTTTAVVKKQQQQRTTTNGQQNSSKRTVYVNSNDPSLCEICLKQWPAKKHLWQHYIRCHKQVAATVCGICLKTNSNYYNLQQHLQQQHPSLLYGQGFGSNFICRICGRYHNASSKLKLHMAIHENFDWNLLNNNDNNDNTTTTTTNDNKNNDNTSSSSSGGNSDNNKDKTNGYSNNNNNNSENIDDNINYESLIEQVECSSNDNTQTSDDDDDDSDDSEDDDSDTDDSSSDNESSNDNESLVTDNSQQQQQQQQLEQNDLDVDDLVDDINDGDIFQTKTEELNSAIQSIEEEFDNIDDDDDDDDDYFCDLQQQQPVLNDNEIESAVGSIL